MKKIPNIIIIFIFSLIIMFPVMKQQYYKGHDTFFHVANINALQNQITLTNPLAKEPLAKIANDFGYGTRLFYPPLPHLTGAYLTKIFENVKTGMKLTAWLTFFLSGISLFLLANKIFKNKKLSLLGACFYMTSPYHLSEIFIRDAFSEMFIPIAIPLIILGLLELIDRNYSKFYLYFVLGYTLAIFSHLAMSIYFTIMLLLTFFPLYRKTILTKQNIKKLLWASVLILLITSPFWLTLLEIKQSTEYAIFIPYYITAKGDLLKSAINPLIYLDFTLPHTYDFIRYHLQLTVTIFFFLGTYNWLKEKKRKDKTFLLLFTILALIMTTKLWPWYYTPDLLQTLQFPWRLCLYVAFGASLVALIPLKKIETTKYFNFLIMVLIGISLIGSLYYTYHVDNETVDLNQINYNLGMGNQEEYLPGKVVKNYEYYKERSHDILIKDQEATISNIKDEVPNLSFDIKTEKETTIELPRLYYIGYELKCAEKIMPLSESDQGFLEATITTSGTCHLKYPGPKSYIISKILCGLTLGGILFFIIIKKSRQRKLVQAKHI